MIKSTKIYCEKCKTDTFVKPNGDCPSCGRLLTVMPGLHMKRRCKGQVLMQGMNFPRYRQCKNMTIEDFCFAHQPKKPKTPDPRQGTS